MNVNRTRIILHVKDHMTVYVFMMILLLTGIVFGAIIVNSMSFIQKEDLFFHMDRYFGIALQDNAIQNKDILKRSYFFHLKYLLLLFTLGLTIIGLPIVWVLVFMKGLVIGFSVGFIVNQLGFKGLLLATVSIAPQNMLIIPIYLIAASMAMIFSLRLLYKLVDQSYTSSIGRPLLRYVSVFMLLLLCAFGSSLMETFIANEAFKAILKTSLYMIINII